MTLNQLIEHIQSAAGTHVKFSTSFLKQYLDIEIGFFRGLTHDKNMEKMVSQFKNEYVNFKANDWYETNRLTPSTRVESFYKQRH